MFWFFFFVPSDSYTALCTLSDGALLLPNLPSTTTTNNEHSKKKPATKHVSSGLQQTPTSRLLTSTSQLPGRDAIEKPQKRQRLATSSTTAQKTNPDRKTLSSASTPPRKRNNDQDVIDLMSSDEKQLSKAKTFPYSHSADDSLLLSSPDSSHTSPRLSMLSTVRYRSKPNSQKETKPSSAPTPKITGKGRNETRFFLDEEESSSDDDDDFDFPSISGQTKRSTSAESGYQNDLDRAIRASLEGTSSKVTCWESTTAREDADTPNRKPAARKVSNDSIVDAAKSATAITSNGAGKKSNHHTFLHRGSSTNNSPGAFSLSSEDGHSVASKNQIGNISPGDLRSRVAQKLHREVIEIDCDSD